MGGGRHASDEEFEFDFGVIKNVLIIAVILLLIGAVAFGSYSLIKKMRETKLETTSAEEEEIVKTHEYDVLGKIKIDKIDMEQEILDSVEEDALENGVIKLYGDKLNNPGNFCIAGHNYDAIFKRLEEMEIGDEFEIIDEESQVTQYKIAQIYSVEPTDLSALKAEAGKTQITLITCENYSTKRLIVKAEMVE